MNNRKTLILKSIGKNYTMVLILALCFTSCGASCNGDRIEKTEKQIAQLQGQLQEQAKKIESIQGQIIQLQEQAKKVAPNFSPISPAIDFEALQKSNQEIEKKIEAMKKEMEKIEAILENWKPELKQQGEASSPKEKLDAMEAKQKEIQRQNQEIFRLLAWNLWEQRWDFSWKAFRAKPAI